MQPKVGVTTSAVSSANGEPHPRGGASPKIASRLNSARYSSSSGVTWKTVRSAFPAGAGAAAPRLLAFAILDLEGARPGHGDLRIVVGPRRRDPPRGHRAGSEVDADDVPANGRLVRGPGHPAAHRQGHQRESDSQDPTNP